MANSADPDQLASTLFAKTGHVVFSKRRVKAGVNCQTDPEISWYILVLVRKSFVQANGTFCLLVLQGN